MALGDQTKALIIMSKNKGWDPTVIPGVGSIANFDKAPNPWELGDQSVGKLPEGTPDSYPQAEEPRYQKGAIDFEVGLGNSDEDSGGTRGTSGADPYAGMGGM